MITIVSPVYKAKAIIPVLVERLRTVLQDLGQTYEIILVNDACPQGSWAAIMQACERYPGEVIGLDLSRNFGQHYAITAGLDAAQGDWVVVMDCDLQDQPEEIPKLYAKAQEGFEIVYARRAQRQDKFFKRLSSKLFYGVYRYLSGIPQDASIANFGIYHQAVIGVLRQMREPMRAFTPMVRWAGFRSTAVDVEHASRYEGETSYNWSKLINLALDIALAYSDKPLRLTVQLGFWIAFAAVLFSLFSLLQYFRGQILVPGYTSLIISIWFLSGLIIFSLGIIGLYISKIFAAVKGRPLYVIREKRQA